MTITTAPARSRAAAGRTPLDRIWLGAGGQPGAVSYARTLALAAAVVTIGANVLQHGLAAHQQVPPWWLVAALAAIPPTALVAVGHQVALLTRPHPLATNAADGVGGLGLVSESVGLPGQ